MYKTDAVGIAAHARLNPENMTHVLFFAVATANCPFGQSVTTLRVLRDWTTDKGYGEALPHMAYAEITMEQKSGMGCGLTGMKLAAYQYLWANRADIFEKYTACLEIDNGHLIFWEYCMDCLCGMGLVKSAFAVQMLFGKLGCIDIHNARELGYTKCPTGKAKKQRPIYLHIQSIKTSEAWWDDWCNFVAAKYPGQFKDGEHVSKLHFDCIVGA